MSERLLRVRELAAMLSLEPRTVYWHYERGDLPGFRLWGSGPLRFRWSEIEQWLDERCRTVTVNDENRNGPAALPRPGPGTEGSVSDATKTLRPGER